MPRHNPLEADAGLELMAFQPQKKKQYSTPYIPSAKTIKVCTTMGVQLMKGFEDRLEKLEGKFQKIRKPKRKPDPSRAQDRGQKDPSTRLPNRPPKDGEIREETSRSNQGNGEGLPKGQPSRQPEK